MLVERMRPGLVGDSVPLLLSTASSILLSEYDWSGSVSPLRGEGGKRAVGEWGMSCVRGL